MNIEQRRPRMGTWAGAAFLDEHGPKCTLVLAYQCDSCGSSCTTTQEVLCDMLLEIPPAGATVTWEVEGRCPACVGLVGEPECRCAGCVGVPAWDEDPGGFWAPEVSAEEGEDDRA